MSDRVPSALIDRYGTAIESEMCKWLDMRARVGIHYDLLRYHLGWLDRYLEPAELQGGKRFRPMLCLLSMEAVGGSWNEGLPVAAAIEFLHNFSLIHDDIEDQDETRHHRPTLWTVWGDALAINAGDAMLALAGLASFGSKAHTAASFRVTRGLQETALALTEGQHLDMGFESTLDVSTDDYLRMIALKTGALITYSCEAGAILGGGSEAAAVALRRFGQNLGMAFQIDDDIRGIWASSDQTGKPEAKDIHNRKKTLPVLLGLERADGAARDLLRTYYGHQATIKPEDIAPILDGLDVRAAVEATRASYLEHALDHLGHGRLQQQHMEELALLARGLVSC